MIRKITKSRLKMKEFPTGLASILDIEAHLESMKLYEDFDPDVIIADYGDIMRSTRKTGSAYEEQGGNCKKCDKHFEIGDMDADHIKPWIEGGKTSPENCQMLCKPCNRRLGAK